MLDNYNKVVYSFYATTLVIINGYFVLLEEGNTVCNLFMKMIAMSVVFIIFILAVRAVVTISKDSKGKFLIGDTKVIISTFFIGLFIKEAFLNNIDIMRMDYYNNLVFLVTALYMINDGFGDMKEINNNNISTCEEVYKLLKLRVIYNIIVFTLLFFTLHFIFKNSLIAMVCIPILIIIHFQNKKVFSKLFYGR